jgi:outer membrane protein TolC
MIIVAELSGITLEECLEKMKENNPLFQTEDTWDSITTFSNRQFNKNYLPQLNLGASSKWQSETMSLGIDNPLIDIPEQSEFSNDVFVELSQIVYDGGITASKKNLQMQSYDIEKQQDEIERLNVEVSIISNYYTILLLEEKRKILERKKTDMDSTLLSIKKAVELGGIPQKKVLEMESILLEINAEIESVNTQKSKSKNKISSMVEINLEDEVFILPQYLSEKERPEWQLFTLQNAILEAQNKLIKSTKMPQVRFGVKTAFGNPGLNMFNDSWTDYTILNLQFQWKIWDWNQSKLQQKENDYKQKLVKAKALFFQKEIEQQRANCSEEIRFLKKENQRLQKDIVIRKKLYEITEKEFIEGISSAIEFRNSFTTYYDALTQQQINRIKQNFEEQKLRRFIGQVKN